MEDLVASTTSLATSRMRAVHARRDPQPILLDPWGDRLVPATLLVASLNPQGSQSNSAPDDVSEDALASITDDYLRASPAYTNVITQVALHRGRTERGDRQRCQAVCADRRGI